jgi:hypothetical protein
MASAMCENRCMSSAVGIGAILIVLIVAAASVHLVLTWMARRGWVWYRVQDRPRPSSVGLVEEIHQPSVEHPTEQQVIQNAEADQTESGEEEDLSTDP